MDCVKIWGYILSDMTDKLTLEQREVLDAHSGHHLELVKYADAYYAIECIDCNEVLFDDGTLLES